MAMTRFGVNDANAVKLWAKSVEMEALKATAIAPLMSKDPDSIIHVKTETSKTAGDQVTFNLQTQLQGDGVGEFETLEGNEEALSFFTDSIKINELSHAVKVPGKRRIDTQRVLFDLRKQGKMALRDWYAKRMSVSFFNQVCGNTAETRLKYTGNNATIAPSATRRIWTETGVTADQSLTSAGKFKLVWLDYAKELAQTAQTPIAPIMVDGEEKYVVYLHPYQVTDLRTDATTAGNWFDIQKAGIQGGQVKKNPIYTGALGEYNGIIIRSSFDVCNGINASTGAVVTTVRRAVFLGRQAAAMAFGQWNEETDTSFDWVEEMFDYERGLGISIQSMFGLKKTQFNSVDYGTIVLSSYAAAHT